MANPTEYKTVQARILAYAQGFGWMFVPRDEAEGRRGFGPHPSPLPADGARELSERARKVTLFFGDLLHSQVRAFNPKYKEAELESKAVLRKRSREQGEYVAGRRWR